MGNREIALLLEEIGNLLELEGANEFRSRAYLNAARSVRDSGTDIVATLRAGAELPKIQGVGVELGKKIVDIVNTGTTPMLERLRKQVPISLLTLLALPGLGPKRVRQLHDELGIKTIDDLRVALANGELDKLAGFGPKMESQLQAALEKNAEPARTLRTVAAEIARVLVAELETESGVSVAPAGSFRRGVETIGNLDLLAATIYPDKPLERLANHILIERVEERTADFIRAFTHTGLRIDLHVVLPNRFGPAWLYYTGSRKHYDMLLQRAAAQQLRLTPEGLYQDGRRLSGDTEASLYKHLGLAWVPPELREGQDEIQRAALGTLPHLIERTDLQGDLHSHSRATDGKNTMEEMSIAAQEAGLSYLAVTDHSQRLTVANGMNADRLLAQLDDIDRINATGNGAVLLKGIEVDILEDGELDLPDSILQRLDIVIASVHSHFGLSRRLQTERLLRALDNRYVTVMGHPSGRRIGTREALDLDMPRLLRSVKQRGCCMEVNGQPTRLDLSDEHCRMAKSEGVRFSIDSDAHGTRGFEHLDFAVLQARRGGLEKGDVINTLPLDEFRQVTRAMRG